MFSAEAQYSAIRTLSRLFDGGVKGGPSAERAIAARGGVPPVAKGLLN